MFVIAATGRIRTIAARRMSLTTMTSLWSQRSTNVPAIGLSKRFGRVAAKKTRPVASAEERDELTRPQRRERRVEGEPDIGMLANGDCGRCRREGSGHGWSRDRT